MSKEMKFFIYLIERYAEKKNVPTGEVLASWDRLGLTDFVYDMYELYHIESLQNAFDDIDRMAVERQGVTE